MKKLISAVTSLCMAASMVSVVAPAAVGAADATKEFSIRTYAEAGSEFDTAGDKVTITKDMLAAGDVTIPCAVYFTEATPDTNTLGVQLTVDSKDISFKLYDPQEEYFSSPKTFTFADGSQVSIKQAFSWCALFDDLLDMYKPDGFAQMACEPSQSFAGTENYFIGYGWNKPTEKPPRPYAWSGAKSDDHPLFVFDVTVPKGIEAGTYTLSYCDYNTDSSGANYNPSCNVEVDGGRYITDDGSLKLNTMTIVVEGEGAQSSTSSSTSTTTTTATTTSSVTTTVTTGGNTDGDVLFNFGTYSAKPGDLVTVNVTIDSKGNPITGIDAFFKLDSPLELTRIGGASPAFGGIGISINVPGLAANFTSIDQDAEGIVPEKDGRVFVLQVQVPDDCPDGEYVVTFGDKAKVFKDNSKFNYEIGVTKGIITVGDPTPTTSSTSETSTTTTTTTNVTSTTTTTVVTSTSTTTTDNGQGGSGGSKLAPTLWGDANCDKTVNVADVVLLNRHMMGTFKLSDQGKVNADVKNPQNSDKNVAVDPDKVDLAADDSESILQSIVHLVELPC